MATRIIEYSDVDRSDGYTAIPAARQVNVQSAITATTTPASSSAFKAHATMVCINSDEAVYVAFGTAPTATVNDYRIPASNSAFFCVPAGASWKVSVRT